MGTREVGAEKPVEDEGVFEEGVGAFGVVPFVVVAD